jgi:hypothetical protein
LLDIKEKEFEQRRGGNNEKKLLRKRYISNIQIRKVKVTNQK